MPHKITLHEQQAHGACGPASLRIVLSHYGDERTEAELRRLTQCNGDGVGAEKLVEVAQRLGYESFFREECSWNYLREEVRKYPVIVDWFAERGGHYSVAIEVYKNRLILADPEFATIRDIHKKDFLPIWFDYHGDYPKTPEDFVLRRMIVVRKPNGKPSLEGSLK